jgi:hypothetical protein
MKYSLCQAQCDLAGLRKIEEDDFGEEKKTEPAEAAQNKAPVARFESLQRCY